MTFTFKLERIAPDRNILYLRTLTGESKAWSITDTELTDVIRAFQKYHRTYIKGSEKVIVAS
jgi:hypothetical protein